MSNHTFQIVIDTNIIYAALYSPQGASYQLMRLVGKGYFDFHISIPLVLEYESVTKRYVDRLPVTNADIDDLIDYICEVGIAHQIYFTWRPFLADPGDEMVLELAVAAGCDAIITFNKKDFRGCEQFGLNILTPFELLQSLGVLL